MTTTLRRPDIAMRPRPETGVADRLLWITTSVIVLALLAIALWSAISVRSDPAGYSFGRPVTGSTLAVVRVRGQTAYFPGVACVSSEPDLIRVSLGDPYAGQANLSAFLLIATVVPASSNAGSSTSFTSLVLGHRPGFSFEQDRMGSIELNSALDAQLNANRTSDALEAGSLVFRGNDAGGAALSGAVSCGTQMISPPAQQRD